MEVKSNYMSVGQRILSEVIAVEDCFMHFMLSSFDISFILKAIESSS